MGFPKKVELKDGRIAVISLLSEKDNPEEMLAFINGLIAENTFITSDEPFTMKAEKDFLSKRMEAFRKKTGYLLVARVNGKLAGTSGAERKEAKARGNVEAGIAVAKDFRRLGLGEAMLRANISLAKRFLKPKNLVLTVFSKNEAARSLYKKLGFREFAVFPDWIIHRREYMDLIHLRLG